MQIVPPDFGTKRENEDRDIVPRQQRFVFEADPVVQTTLSGQRPGAKESRVPQIPGPTASFDAQNITSSPPDPNGAVGPNHVVTMANLSFLILNKTGTDLVWAGGQ